MHANEIAARNTTHLSQGGFFNWLPPKNHKYYLVGKCFQKNGYLQSKLEFQGTIQSFKGGMCVVNDFFPGFFSYPEILSKVQCHLDWDH